MGSYAVLGVSASVSSDFKKLHAGEHCVDFADFIANAAVVSIVGGEGEIVVGSVTAH